ncbi:RNA polymerase sigma factor [Mediterraneibacter gnavus]
MDVLIFRILQIMASNKMRCNKYGKLKNYLYVVAKYTIKDFFRKRCETTEKLEVESSCDGGLDNVPLQVDIWREIQRLDPLDKELIILRYYQDLRVKDIAQIVNLPTSTVGYKIKRIEKLLKLRLEEMKYER